MKLLTRMHTWATRLLRSCALVALVSAVEPGVIAQTPTATDATADETSIRKIIQDETTAWNRGDAAAYSRQFASDGTFTNIRGQFFTGYEAFLKQHEVIFQGIFKNTTLQQDIVSLKFINPDVAMIETLSSVSSIKEPAPGMTLDSKGRLRTRLLQVITRQGSEWKIVGYHNVDVKPGVPVPEPK
jgi:uncharacterized protein (TIGR02246 family)